MTKRNYEREYSLYGSKTIADRSSRNKARRIAKKKYGAKKLRGKDVHHKNGNPKDNSKSNLTIRSRKAASGQRKSRYGRRSMTIAGRLGIMDPMLEGAMMGQTNRG